MALDLLGRKVRAFFRRGDHVTAARRESTDNEGYFRYVLVSPTPSPPPTPVLAFTQARSPSNTTAQTRNTKRYIATTVQRTRSEPITQAPKQERTLTAGMQRNRSEPTGPTRSRKPSSRHRTIHPNTIGVQLPPVASPGTGDAQLQGPSTVDHYRDPNSLDATGPSLSSPATTLVVTNGNLNKPLPSLPNDAQSGLGGSSFFTNAHDLSIPTLNIQNIHNNTSSKTVFDRKSLLYRLYLSITSVPATHNALSSRTARVARRLSRLQRALYRSEMRPAHKNRRAGGNRGLDQGWAQRRSAEEDYVARRTRWVRQDRHRRFSR